MIKSLKVLLSALLLFTSTFSFAAAGLMYEQAPIDPRSVKLIGTIPIEESSYVEIELSFDYLSNGCGDSRFLGFIKNYQDVESQTAAFLAIESPLNGGCANRIVREPVTQKIRISRHPEKGTKWIKINNHRFTLKVGSDNELAVEYP